MRIGPGTSLRSSGCAPQGHQRNGACYSAEAGFEIMLWIMNEAGSIPFLTNMMRTHIAKRAAEGSIGARTPKDEGMRDRHPGKIDETLVEDLASESRVILTGIQTIASCSSRHRRALWA